jgi:hypothetical protein
MKNLLVGVTMAASLGALTLPTPADAVVLTFEDIQLGEHWDPGFNFYPPLVSNGFDLRSPGNHFHVLPPSYDYWFPTGGTNTAYIDSNSLQIKRVDGGLFYLGSFNYSSLRNGVTAIKISSFLNGNAVDSFFVNSLGNEMQSGNGIGGFSSLSGYDTLLFERVSGTFALDNVSLTLGDRSVPEPATWLTMILGFAAIGFGLRRKQRQTVRYSFG